MGDGSRMQQTWGLAFHAGGVLRLQVDTCAEKEVNVLEPSPSKPASKWDK